MTKTIFNRRGNLITEKDVEKRGSLRLTEIGFKSEKFNSVNNKGVPDQLVTGYSNHLWPTPLVFFVEYKKPNETPTRLQRLDHRERRSRGYYVFVVDCYEHVEIMVKFVQHMFLTGRILPHPDELL